MPDIYSIENLNLKAVAQRQRQKVFFPFNDYVLMQKHVKLTDEFIIKKKGEIFLFLSI